MNRTPAPARSQRQSADERRAAIVAAAVDEVAAKGLAGSSTDVIAHRAGVSQPYVFQLFGTKKDLFIAVVRHVFGRTRIAFEDAADRFDRGDRFGVDCDSPLHAMGQAYIQLLADRTLLLVQLQAYAACSDPEVRTAVGEAFLRLHRYVADRSGASAEDLHAFFAEGMLLNVGAAIRFTGDPARWSLDLLGGHD